MAEHKNERWSIFEELKRRRLFRSAATYVVGAWLLVQISDILLPIYGAPEWALRAIVTLLVVGFTPAMIFAWLYNITNHGIEATGDAPRQVRMLTTTWFRAAVGGTTIVATGIVIWSVWTDYLAEPATEDAASRLATHPVVAVTPIRNVTGNAELDWLSEGMANFVRTDLAQSRHVVVVSKSRWDSIARQAASTGQSTDDIAKTTGIEYVFGGEFISTPGGLFLSVHLTDLRRGVQRASETFQNLTPETMLASADRLAMLARRDLRIPHTESVDSFAADFAVNNMTAYEAYVGGLEYFRRFQYGEAEQAFATALEFAPEFHIARYRLAHVYMSTGRQTEALETIGAIPDDAAFDRREELYVEAAKAFFSFDLESSIKTYGILLEEFPYEVEARQFLAEVHYHNYEVALAVEELRILARQEPENEIVWSTMGAYLVLSGHLEEAEAPLETYLELAAEKAHPLTMLGDLQRQRGEYEQSVDYYTRALETNPDFTEAKRGQAQVLALLGDVAAAKAIWRAIIDDPSIAADERIYAAFDFTYVLRSEGRFRDSLEPLLELEDAIRAEISREPMALVTRALSLMELGEATRAAGLIGRALELNQRVPNGYPTRYLFARGLLELHDEEFEAVLRTANEIRSHAAAPDDPDQTEARAASYLEGLALSAMGKSGDALVRLRKGLELGGYDYAIYELALARALAANGELEAALNFAQQAENYRNIGEVRLDLELDRVRAGLLLAEIQRRLGNDAAAGKQVAAFLRRWNGADRAHPDLEHARALAASW